MHAPIRRLLLVAAVLAVGSSAVGQAMLTNRLDSESYWFSASNTPGFTVANQTLTVGAGKQVVTYFAPLNSPITLAVNEELVASFKLRFDSVTDSQGSFRVGLFNSSSGGYQTGNADLDQFSSYRGYLVSWNPKPGSASNGLGIRERLSNTTSTELLSSTASFTSPLSGTGSSTGKNFTVGTTYDATYSVLRTGSGVTLTFEVTGGGLVSFKRTVSDTTDPFVFSFDTFGLYSLTGTSDFNVSNLAFTINGAVSAVPEPSTYAACAGAAVLGLAFWRRRRAAAKAVVA